MVFENFLADMGHPPGPKHSIDRIKNDKGYFKENCRWATAEEQSRNRRWCKIFTIDGVTKTLEEWSKQMGINAGTIEGRIARGLTPEAAITLPAWNKSARTKKRIGNNGNGRRSTDSIK